MSDCLNHPGIPAKTNCAVCGKPVCKECITAKKFCSAQCAASAAVSRDSGENNRNRELKKSGSWVRPTAILLILAMLGFCAYHYYKRNRKDVNNRFNQVKTKGRDAINDGQKYLRKDSKYKSDREAQLK